MWDDWTTARRMAALWTVGASMLGAAAVASWGYVAWERFAQYSRCYDIQGDDDTQQACDAYSARIVVGVRVMLIVAVVSLAIMVPPGLLDGRRRLAFAERPAEVVWLLIVGNPAAFLGYLIGWLVGRLPAAASTG